MLVLHSDTEVVRDFSGDLDAAVRGEAASAARAAPASRPAAGVTWEPRRGSPGEAAMALLANTVRARIAPADALSVLARAAEQAVLLAGPRGDADDTALRQLAR